MNQYPNASYWARFFAKQRGDKTYESGTACKHCGSLTKHVANSSCAVCCNTRNRHKLDALAQSKKPYNPVKRRRNLLRGKYKISPAEYERILLAQNGKCAICGVDKCSTGRHFAVDHDHVTNTVRGLLCRACNQGLGQFKDNPDVLHRAASYLKGEFVE